MLTSHVLCNSKTPIDTHVNDWQDSALSRHCSCARICASNLTMSSLLQGVDSNFFQAFDAVPETVAPAASGRSRCDQGCTAIRVASLALSTEWHCGMRASHALSCALLAQGDHASSSASRCRLC